MAVDILAEVKARLGITGTYHDATLAGYIADVKRYLLASGVPLSAVDGEEAVGAIARGVADLWDYGSGEGRFSPVFLQRAVQMAYGEQEDGE